MIWFAGFNFFPEIEQLVTVVKKFGWFIDYYRETENGKIGLRIIVRKTYFEKHSDTLV
jgi:hypothetical protein